MGGYVLALPREKYTEIEANLEETIVKDGEIDYEYEQKYLLIAFTQKDVKEESDKKTFKITYYDSASGSMEEAACAKSDYDYDYGIDDVYTVKQPDTHGYAITIDPFMDGSFEIDWTVQIFLGDEDVTKDYLEPEDKTFTRLELLRVTRPAV